MTSPTLPLGQQGEQCRSCAAPLATDQRYCLNCGQRRGEPRVAYDRMLREAAPDAVTSREQVPGGPAPFLPATGPRTISPMGAAAGLGLLLFAVLTGATLGNRTEPSAAAPQTVIAAAATTPVTTTPAVFVSDWTGADGWTVQLQGLPKAENTPEQVAAAKAAATAAGATDVGALDTSTYPSLPADTYLVYSGRFDDKKAAKAALKDLKASFPDAAVVEVSTTAAAESSAGAADEKVKVDKETTKALDDLSNASGEDYVKKSKKLPDDVGTAGTPPPKDNAAPGGGSDEVTEIQ